MRVHPLVVLLFNLLLPVAIMFPGNPYQHGFFLTFAAAAFLWSGKVKRLAKFGLFYGAMLLLSVALRQYSGVAIPFFIMFITLTLQFVPCAMMASILIWDTSASELIAALALLRLPKAFIIALTVVLRYIPTFRREFVFIKEAMRLRRVPYSLRHPLRSFEFFLVPQLFRCALLANEITAAGLTKGITSPDRRSAYSDGRLRLADCGLCAILLLGTGGMLLWR